MGGLSCGQQGQTNNGKDPPQKVEVLLPQCPMTAILKYTGVRGSSSGPLFCGSDLQSVTKAWFVEQVREMIAGIGLPLEQYAGHSFRIGAVTTAAMAGGGFYYQTLGRWHSMAYLQYIWMPSERLAGLSKVLAGRTGATTVITLTHHALMLFLYTLL